MSARFHFQAKLWRYSGEAAWHFITVPKETSAHIRALTKGLSSAFGSLRVIASIGEQSWRTSLFPDSKLGAFLLPVKADVRRKQNIGHGDEVAVTLEIDL